MKCVKISAMNLTTREASGVFDFSKLAHAANEQMTEFTTTDWSGSSVLFAKTADGINRFPHYADGLLGYLPYWGENGSHHPLEAVETVLRQQLHTTAQPLRLLSYQVGQITNTDRKGRKIYDWERTIVRSAHTSIEGSTLKQPKSSWSRSDFVNYYRQIRIVEAEKLRQQVVGLAGHIVAQNEIEQLYVAKNTTAFEDRGWMAPLVGLSIDTGQENVYNEQVHNVFPVVRQHDGTMALLCGAYASLYTADAPGRGMSTLQ